MLLSLRIARRYLFAKKTTNAVNIITGISVLGIAVSSAALILVLSVFNGFDDLIAEMYSSFNPDIKVTPTKGKTFELDSTIITQLAAIDEVEAVAQTLEEVAFFEYKNNQDFGILKGVDENFRQVVNIDSTVLEGQYGFKDGARQTAVLGLGMRNKLAVNVGDRLSEMGIYLPKREKSRNPLEQPFRRRFIYPGGTFVIQTDFDNQYVLTSLDFVREILGYENALSALEVKLKAGSSTEVAIGKIQNLLGDSFEVKDRYKQEEAFFRLMQVEKWLSYAIVGLMLIIVLFNMIGALWMMVLEKQKDISILKAMGAFNTTVRDIFLSEGLLLCAIGLFIGYIIAITLYILQKTVGLITVPGNFIVEAYPISLRGVDFIVVALTVLLIGLLASLAPALRAVRVPPMMREE
ncbi:MAG TPA: FtsX-like permease family protein [Saprospiraceae bacterium]|nr:FtsX-like permease family protein [Saprospiraceae bacterium]HMQ82023.1 FtsX-like permease family protein [Saprospiraceae bacterium]